MPTLRDSFNYLENIMSNPTNLKYTASHEWVKTEADGTITIGITQHAQEQLGDMVFVEAPAAGRKLKAKEECAVVESVKAAADVYAPVSGEVIAANSELDSTPEQINNDPYGAWIFKMKPDSAADVAALLDAATYQAGVDSEAH
jgi:glycine cleavage system H protein